MTKVSISNHWDMMGFFIVYLFIYLFIFIFFLVFLPFLGSLPQHMEVPRLGVELEL